MKGLANMTFIIYQSKKLFEFSMYQYQNPTVGLALWPNSKVTTGDVDIPIQALVCVQH